MSFDPITMALCKGEFTPNVSLPYLELKATQIIPNETVRIADEDIGALLEMFADMGSGNGVRPLILTFEMGGKMSTICSTIIGEGISFISNLALGENTLSVLVNVLTDSGATITVSVVA